MTHRFTQRLTHRLALAVVAAALTPIQANAQGTDITLEKCFGIVKAGMNDCKNGVNDCASTSTQDNQADAFILLPKGACERITGASLTPKEAPKETAKEPKK